MQDQDLDQGQEKRSEFQAKVKKSDDDLDY